MAIIRSFSLLLAVCVVLFGHLFNVCVGQNLIAELRAEGIELVAPGDQGFGTASAAFNNRFTFKPAAVTFPSSTDHVSTIIKTANKYNTRVSARSGGHSYIANGLGGSDGLVVIDLNKHLTNIESAPSSNHAKIQSGSRLGDIALTLNANGQGIGHGTCPYVGIGGHASFGGFGYASRLWGMVLDVVEEVDLVLSNGTIATASKTQNSELFWGMRGAGPSFGITTSITVQTFPIPPSATVFLYTWNMTASEASSLLNAFQSFSLGQVPPEFGSELLISKGGRRGLITVTLQGVWFGPDSSFEAIISPLVNSVGQKPKTRLVQPGPYIDSIKFFGDSNGQLNTTVVPDDHSNFYVKSLLTPQSQPISTDSSGALMQYLATTGFDADIDWFIEVEEFGGPGSVVNNVPVDDTAFVTRSALFLIQFYGFTDDNSAAFPNDGFNIVDGMVNSIIQHMPSTWDYKAYANYLDDRLENWQHLYFGGHYPRLQQLKASVDPDNRFHFPTSIELPS